MRQEIMKLYFIFKYSSLCVLIILGDQFIYEQWITHRLREKITDQVGVTKIRVHPSIIIDRCIYKHIFASKHSNFFAYSTDSD